MEGSRSGTSAIISENTMVTTATKTQARVARTLRPSGASNLRSRALGQGASASAIRTGGTTCREAHSHWRLLLSEANVGSTWKMPGTATAIWMAAAADQRKANESARRRGEPPVR